MALSVVGDFTLGEVNVAAGTALTLFNPLLAQFDLSLTGSVGLGALQTDLSAQFDAALQAQVDLNVQVSNPLEGIQAVIAGVQQLLAGLQASLSFGPPTVTADLNASISAQAAITSALGAKISGLEALLEASLNVKAPAVEFLGNLTASLSAGPIFLLAFNGDSLSSTGGQIQSAMTAGLSGGSGTINPGEACYGILLVTKSPAAWAAIQAVMKTA